MPNSIHIPSDLNARIDATAAKWRRRKSQVVRETLDRYLDFWEQTEEAGEEFKRKLIAGALGPIVPLPATESQARDCVDLNLWRQSHARPLKGGAL